MKDITPKHLRCSLGGCPAVLEITPADLQCQVTVSCPAVFEASGNLLIIGKKPSPELLAQIEGRVGEDEYAIVIGRKYLEESGLFQSPHGESAE